MNKLNDAKELTGETAEELEPFKAMEKIKPEDFAGFNSVIGTDIQSVNVAKTMITTSEIVGDENLNEKNPNSAEGQDRRSSVEDGNENLMSFSKQDETGSENQGEQPEILPDLKTSTPDDQVLNIQELNSEKIPAPQIDDADRDIEEEVIIQKDLNNYTKEELINEFQLLLNHESLKEVERKIFDIKSGFEELREADQKTAEVNFVSGGGDISKFNYVNDKLDSRFEALLNRYKSKKASYIADLEKQKDINLQKKHEVLETLRKLVDAEETTTSISVLKKIQQEWRSIGPVQNQYIKSLWASYNALLDRFYDNRSIYFELKELDRKKNLESKIEICDKAEKLVSEANLKNAIKVLNDLHEEFKHIGPVPGDQQEIIWQRFKTASDQVYSRRKDFLHDLKKNQQENFEHKSNLISELENYRIFNSDNISEWNNKTREILDIQKKWETIGGVPKEHTKLINKNFWSAFKLFFKNKNEFFKKLENKREENLKRKEELVIKALALRESDDWESTANKLKELQVEWKNIGPVPDKFKTDVFDRFKQACDEFFDKRRNHSKEVEIEYVNNLKRKEQICESLEKMIAENTFVIDRFQALQAEFENIGYVPRNTIKKIQKRFSSAAEKFLELADVPDVRKNELKFSAELNKIKSSPDSGRKLQRKEMELRKMINKLENDISVWRNNLDFFKESDTADKLRAEFNLKIDKASAQLHELKDELRILIKS